MKNKEIFKTDCEARDAHKNWCKGMAETWWMCTQECKLCLEAWLDKEATEEKKDAKQG